MPFKTLFVPLGIFGVVLTVSAQGLPQRSVSPIIHAYRFYKEIDSVAIRAPTVVEVPIADEFIERVGATVLDKTTGAFEPHFFKQEILINEIPVFLSTDPNTGSAHRMNDTDTSTYADFPLPNTAQGRVRITLSSSRPISSSALTTLLGNNVALPSAVEIRAFVEGQDRIVVAYRRMDQHTVRFPQTTSTRWVISFTFSQPLRISELKLHQDSATITGERAIRFLAQPDHSYRSYFDPDRLAAAPVGEAGNLVTAEDVLVLPAVPSQRNPDYRIADTDSDGVPDIRDNCVSVANADQRDINGNSRGDACDDFDQDGISNDTDNCPDNPNRDQADTDGDGIGDVCDEEESRITERYPWVPWIGIGFAAGVLIVLFVLTARSARTTAQEES